jgi:hypothetical protein
MKDSEDVPDKLVMGAANAPFHNDESRPVKLANRGDKFKSEPAEAVPVRDNNLVDIAGHDSSQ